MTVDLVKPQAGTSEAERRADRLELEALELCRWRAAVERQRPQRHWSIDELVELLRQTDPDTITRRQAA